MSDFFIHNGDSFLPEYLPGIIGYGQNGAPGNKGEDAPSVYYASYDLNNKTDMKSVKKRILNNQQLSNNITLPNDNEYKVNDLIIDRSATFYKITVLNKVDVTIERCANSIASNYSPITTSFCGFNVKCSTSFLKSSTRKWLQPNPNYDPTLARLNYSPKIYHHNRLEEKVYGNFITFNLIQTPNHDISKYTYKFVLVLPNGQTFEYYSDSNACTIFLENKILFGCFSTNEWKDLMNFDMNSLKETAISKLISSEDEILEEKIDSNLGIFTKIDPLKYVNDEFNIRGVINPNDIKNDNTPILSYYYKDANIFSKLNAFKSQRIFSTYNEKTNELNYPPTIIDKGDSSTFIGNYDHLEDYLKSKEITILLSYFIKYECSAYCEITDTESGIVYRVDINDIFINENYTRNTNRDNYIQEALNSISWNDEILKFDRLQSTNLFNNFLTYDYNGETRLFNPMNSYVIFSHQEDITKMNTISEDGVVEKLYFIDASGFTAYLDQSNDATQAGGFIGKNFANGESQNTAIINNICQTWGVDVTTVKQDDGLGNQIDVPVYRDSNRTIKLTFSNLSAIKVNIKYNKNPEGTSTEYPQALVYIGYIDHPLIVLPSKDEDAEPAGIYYLSKVVPPGYYIKENEADYTKTSLAGMTESTIRLSDYGISDTKSHYIEIGVTLLDTENNSRLNINNAHRKSYGRDHLFSFLDEENSGTEDLNIYVSGVKELSEDELTRPEDEEFDFNNFNSIHCDKPKDINTTD